MGREIKRVALNFDFPLGKTWTGYLNPFNLTPCPACGGRGSHASMQALERLVHLLMIAGSDSQGRPAGYDGQPLLLENWPGSSYQHHFPHPWLVEAEITDPGDCMHELTAGLAERPPRGLMGHDAMDSWKATAKIIAAAGLPETWGACKVCEGSGRVKDEALEAKRAAWTKTEPPAGEGWQLWQTVSEGGPVSPVFSTPEGLANWITVAPRPRDRMPYEHALAFVTKVGWALSMVGVEGEGVEGGMQAAGRAAAEGGTDG